MAYDNSNQFTLSRNEKRNNDRQPEFRGELDIDGVKYELAAWVREVRSGPNAGKKFFSGKVSPKADPNADSGSRRQQPPQQQRPAPTPKFDPVEEEGIPF